VGSCACPCTMVVCGRVSANVTIHTVLFPLPSRTGLRSQLLERECAYRGMDTVCAGGWASTMQGSRALFRGATTCAPSF
jgi:hypothetical protein